MSFLQMSSCLLRVSSDEHWGRALSIVDICHSFFTNFRCQGTCFFPPHIHHHLRQDGQPRLPLRDGRAIEFLITAKHFCEMTGTLPKMMTIWLNWGSSRRSADHPVVLLHHLGPHTLSLLDLHCTQIYQTGLCANL